VSGVHWVSTYDHESKEHISYAYTSEIKAVIEKLPAGWVVCIDGKWVARTPEGLRADFDSKDEALSFLTLLVSAGN
jgi:hypothetical protein